MRVDARPGDVVRRGPRGIDAVEVVRNGTPVASISDPVALDADGQRVPTTMTLEGDVLRIEVDHAAGDFKYPLLVDPQVTDEFAWDRAPQTNAPNPVTNHAEGWTLDTNGGNYTGYGYCSGCHLGPGMYVFTGKYLQNVYLTAFADVGWWNFQAPGDSRVVRFNAYALVNDPRDDDMCIYTGIQAQSGNWEAAPHAECYGVFSYNTSFDADDAYGGGSTAGNIARFGSVPRSTGWRISEFYERMGYAAVTLADDAAPTFTDVDVPSGWTNDPGRTVAATANDSGLGLQSASMTIDDAGSWSGAKNPSGTCRQGIQQCSTSIPLPGSVGNLSSGIHTLRLAATDIAGNNSVRSDLTVKVDREPPALDISGSLKDIAGGNNADADLYELQVGAHDGSQGSPATRRSGVTEVEVKLDGQRQGYLSSPCPSDSCALSLDEIALDTDTLTPGSHSVTVTAKDAAGNDALQSWSFVVARDDFYAQEVAAWSADVQQRVDAALPLSLTRPFPATPVRWRDPAGCAASESATHDCFEVGKGWQADVGQWLRENDPAAQATPNLPDMPIYGYARDRLARELTRALAGGFAAERDSAADITARADVLISFHAPQTPAALTTLQATIGFVGLTSAKAIWEPSTDASAVPVSAGFYDRSVDLLSNQIDYFYSQQAVAADEVIDGLQDDLQQASQTADEAAGTQASIDDAQAYKAFLSQRGALVTGIVVRADLSAVLRALQAPGSALKSVEELAGDVASADGADGALRTDFEASHEAARRDSAEGTSGTAAAGTRAAATRPSRTYAPNLFNLRTYAETAASSSPYIKKTYMGFKWNQSGTLDYYRGDDPHDRGIEMQGRPPAGSPIWSSDWEGDDVRGCLVTSSDPSCKGTWNSNMPDAYRDDLFEDGDYKSFAIGSGNGRALRYKRGYWAYYLTNKGNSSTGSAVYEAQATRRSKRSRPQEWAYCRGRIITDRSADRDARCFFAEATTLIAQFPLERVRHRFSTVWP